jgi:hypothetical protein
MNEANNKAKVTLRPLNPRHSQESAKGLTYAAIQRLALAASNPAGLAISGRKHTLIPT